jgi:hypothetical protein
MVSRAATPKALLFFILIKWKTRVLFWAKKNVFNAMKWFKGLILKGILNVLSTKEMWQKA